MKLKSDLTKMNESFKALTEKSGNTDSDNLIDQIKFVFLTFKFDKFIHLFFNYDKLKNYFDREFVSENFEDDEKLHVCKPKDWIEHPEVFMQTYQIY